MSRQNIIDCMLLVFAIFTTLTTIFIIAFLSAAGAHAVTSDLQQQLNIHRTFFFEQHGRDDAREWQAMFTKGVRVTKIDFNFRSNATECASQTRVNKTSHGNGAFPNGCLILSHYYDKTVHNYFTPTDLLDFVNSNRDADFFSPGRTSVSGPVIVQMCLKNKPGGCCPQQAVGSKCDQWTKLFDAFYAEAVIKIGDMLNNGQITFVFDSLGVSGDACFFVPQRRYGDWNSTWTGNLASAQNNSGANSAEQMPNMDWSSWSSWESIGGGKSNWAKFRSESTAFPIVAWEPSSEFAMGLWYSWFLSTNLYRPSGVLIAYNPDPAYYSVLNAPVTKRFAHDIVDNSAQEMMGPVAAMFTTTISQSNGNNFDPSSLPYLYRCASSSRATTPTIECVFHQRTDHSQFPGISSTLHTLPANLVSNVTLPLLHVAVEGPWTNPPPAPRGLQYRVTLVDSLGVFTFLQMTISSPFGPVLSAPPKYTQLCSPIAPFGIDRVNGQLFGVNSWRDATRGDGSALSFVGVHLENGGPGPTISKMPLGVIAIEFATAPPANGSSSVCPAWSLSLFETRVVADVCHNNSDNCGIFRGRNHNHHNHNRNPRHERFVKRQSSDEHASRDTNWFAAGVAATTKFVSANSREMRVIACYNTDRSVFCSTSVFSNSSASSASNFSPFMLQYAVPNVTGFPVLVGKGTRPTVSFAMVPSNRNNSGSSSSRTSEPAFIVRYGFSFCFNDMPIDDNSVQFYGWHICDLRDDPTPEIVPSPMNAYLFSHRVSVLEQRLSEGNRHINGFATSCDPEFLHGIYDSSVDSGNPILIPAGASFDDDLPVSPTDGYYVAVVPASSLVYGAPSTCGSSLPQGSKIRLDAFPLPGMWFNYSSHP